MNADVLRSLKILIKTRCEAEPVACEHLTERARPCLALEPVQQGTPEERMSYVNRVRGGLFNSHSGRSFVMNVLIAGRIRLCKPRSFCSFRLWNFRLLVMMTRKRKRCMRHGIERHHARRIPQNHRRYHNSTSPLTSAQRDVGKPFWLH